MNTEIIREEFTAWLRREMPANTIISDPDWWALYILGAIGALDAKAEQARQDGEQELLRLIDDRDYWEEKATDLAEKIGAMLGVDVGEHTSKNCPVESALDAIEEKEAEQAEQAEQDCMSVCR